jgi:hypothetical protein
MSNGKVYLVYNMINNLQLLKKLGHIENFTYKIKDSHLYIKVKIRGLDKT